MTESLIIIAFLCLFHLLDRVIHWKERRDLLDRLMARDLPELATFQIERERASIKTDKAKQDFVQF